MSELLSANIRSVRKYKKALVVGCGRSGRAAEALLRSERCETLSLDESTTDLSSFKSQVSNFLPETAVVSQGSLQVHLHESILS
jgi:UDP-N-acetylmuramoylalanine-D-glutamate ligase